MSSASSSVGVGREMKEQVLNEISREERRAKRYGCGGSTFKVFFFSLSFFSSSSTLLSDSPT